MLAYLIERLDALDAVADNLMPRLEPPRFVVDSLKGMINAFDSTLWSTLNGAAESLAKGRLARTHTEEEHPGRSCRGSMSFC